MQISGGVIKPEANKWGSKSEYQKAIKAAGFTHQIIDAEENNGKPEKNNGKPEENKPEENNGKSGEDPEGKNQDNYGFNQDGTEDGSNQKPSEGNLDPYQFHQGADGNSSDKQNKPGDSKDVSDSKPTETSPEKDYQDKLDYAAKHGLPVVVVFGNQEAKDTEKAAKNLQSNMQQKDAVYIYADTNKIDPNSDLGKVIRRNASSGEGLGESGKSDMSFTGVYTVEKKADGSLGLGRTIATVHGGRDEISAIVKDQLQYAKAGTLKTGGGDDVAPGDQTDKKPNDQNFRPEPGPQQPDANKPNNPGDNNNRPDAEKKDGSKDREAFQKERDERYRQRLKELEDVGGKKGYTLKQYAQGWGRFLERTEVPEGPVRDALDEFGKQMLTGDFDAKKLAEMMDKASAGDQKALNEALLAANKELAGSGLRLNTEVDQAGKLKSIELTEAVARGQARNSLKITADGKFLSGSVIDLANGNPKMRPLPLEEVSRRLAKRSEPAACP